MRVSVVIVNWNTRDLLRNCLQTLLQQKKVKTEIIVVDNHSSDGSAAMVRQEFPQVILLSENHNHGYAAGNNLGFTKATGDFVVTLNPDTELGPNVLSDAAEVLNELKYFGVLGVKQIGKDEKIQHSVRGFPTCKGIAGDLLKLNVLSSKFDTYRLSRFDYNVSQPAPQPMGTFLMFKREALEKIAPQLYKPFDEQFPIFFNEVDLLYRLDKLNVQCWYESSVEILHLGGESTKQVRPNMIWESHRSLIRYFKKHPQSCNQTFLPIVSAIIWLGAFIRAKGVHAGFRP